MVFRFFSSVKLLCVFSSQCLTIVKRAYFNHSHTIVYSQWKKLRARNSNYYVAPRKKNDFHFFSSFLYECCKIYGKKRLIAIITRLLMFVRNCVSEEVEDEKVRLDIFNEKKNKRTFRSYRMFIARSLIIFPWMHCLL